MRMMKKVLALIFIGVLFFSCKTEEPPVATYKMQVDNALVNDTIDHKVSYKFQVINNQTSTVETGTWEVQLLKQDSSYFTVSKEENSQKLNILAGSLVEKIPTDQLFQYDGLRIKGRIFFYKNDGQVTVEKAFTVWGKPTVSLFRIKLIEDNGYPNEKNVTLEFKYQGATRLSVLHENDDYGYSISFMLDMGTYSEVFNDLDIKTKNKFSVQISNFLGTTISDPIYIGED